MTEITDPVTGEKLTLDPQDIGVSPIDHARLRKHRDELRDALTQIRDDDFDGSYVLMRDGKWRGMAMKMKEIAELVLANTEQS